LAGISFEFRKWWEIAGGAVGPAIIKLNNSEIRPSVSPVTHLSPP
jgi:hypothetical protein